MNIKKFSGYFCKKCNLIPLIQIVPKSNDIKILSLCKCHREYLSIDTFNKIKYSKDKIDINQISNESILAKNFNIDEAKINSIIEKFYETKERLGKEINDAKNIIIQTLKDEIEEVNKIYNNYILHNNKIIDVVENLIESYKLIKNNFSNALNVIYNSNFNVNDIIGRIKCNINSNLLIHSQFRKVLKDEYILPYWSKEDLYETQ